jgi:hypothetical protein
MLVESIRLTRLGFFVVVVMCFVSFLFFMPWAIQADFPSTHSTYAIRMNHATLSFDSFDDISSAYG